MHDGRTCEQYDAELQTLKDQADNAAKSEALIKCGSAVICSNGVRHRFLALNNSYAVCAGSFSRTAQSTTRPLRRMVDVTTSSATRLLAARLSSITSAWPTMI